MGAAEDAEEELARTPLQAIILADSFTTKFRPITLERPKVTFQYPYLLLLSLNLYGFQELGLLLSTVSCLKFSFRCPRQSESLFFSRNSRTH